jgi:hypothetical protein
MNFTSDDASVKLSKCLQHLNYSNLPNLNKTKKQARALPVVYREYKSIRKCTSGRRAFENTLDTICTQLSTEPLGFYALIHV